nr:retrotransposon protein, putative, Ty1-copia subclass [Tanacetum cinerariifolium]
KSAKQSTTAMSSIKAKYIAATEASMEAVWIRKYIDGLGRNNVTMLQEVKSWLCKCFSIKDLGEAVYILGIKIIRDGSKRFIALSQSAYLDKILKRIWIENSKKGYTPMIEKSNYRKSQGAKTPSEAQRMQRVPYASTIGSIMKSAKQSTTAMSSIKAKYIAAAEASMEANKRPIEMLCDNEPAIEIANDPGILKRAKHFQRKYHYIREVIQECEIVLKKVHTDENVADSFTKPMSYDKHYDHDMAIGIVPSSSLM